MKAKNRQLNFDDEVFYLRKRVQIERRFFQEKFNNFAKESTPELLAAARSLDLDPSDPIESAVLLRALAELSFRQSPKGRPVGSKVWGSERLLGLWHHYSQIRKENSRIKNERAAHEIKHRWPQFYKNDSVTTLRQRIPSARQAYAILVKRLDDEFLRDEEESWEWDWMERQWEEERREEERREEEEEEERREEERREEERREELLREEEEEERLRREERENS